MRSEAETYTVELVYADNGSSADKAPSAAQQLVSEGVSVVLGSYGSGVSIAAGSQYFADAGIPAIGVTCTNPQVTAGNTHYFRICFLDPFQGTVLANYAYSELGAKTAYCLAELGNDYDVGLCHYFQQAFEALGGTVIYRYLPHRQQRLYLLPFQRDRHRARKCSSAPCPSPTPPRSSTRLRART